MTEPRPAADAASEKNRIHFETLEKRTFLSAAPAGAEFHVRFALITSPTIRAHVQMSRDTSEFREQVHAQRAMPVRFHMRREFVVMFHVPRPDADSSQAASEPSTSSRPPLPPPQNQMEYEPAPAPAPAVSAAPETPSARPVQEVSHQAPRVQKVDSAPAEAAPVPPVSSLRNALPMVLAPSIAVANSLTRSAGELLHGDAIGAPAKIAPAPRELTSLKLSVGDTFGGSLAEALERAGVSPSASSDLQQAVPNADQGSLAQKIGSVLSPQRVYQFVQMGSPLTLLSDSIAAFAEESVSMPASLVGSTLYGSPGLARAITTAVIAADVILLTYAHHRRRQAQRAKGSVQRVFVRRRGIANSIP